MSETVCRLCLCDMEPGDGGCSVLDAAFQKALEAVFSFMVIFQDGLPRNTCKRCSWNVLDFHSFSEIVKRNQEKLQIDSLQTNLSDESYANDTDEDFESDEIEKDNWETMNVTNIKEQTGRFSNSSTSSASKTNLDECGAANEIQQDAQTSTNQENGANVKQNSATINEKVITVNATRLSSGPALSNSKTIEPLVEQSKSNSETIEKDTIITNHRSTLTKVDREESKNHNPSAKRKRAKCSEDEDNTDTDLEYSCTHCERKFESKWQYDYHQREHTIAKCPWCYLSVPVKHLNTHILTHRRDILCTLCKKYFLSKPAFTKHKNECAKVKATN